MSASITVSVLPGDACVSEIWPVKIALVAPFHARATTSQDEDQCQGSNQIAQQAEAIPDRDHPLSEERRSEHRVRQMDEVTHSPV